MSRQSASVRAVVVSWNGVHLLGPCLDSLQAQALGQHTLRIIVVDNASTDGTCEFLAARYPLVEVRVSDVNRGFAGGANIGLADLDEDYALLLNNDATLEPEAVQALVAHLETPANHTVGAATAKILLTEPDADGRTLLNSTGNVLTRSGAATDRNWLTPEGTVHPSTEVFGFCGGAALLRGTTLVEVGIFDDSLFLYYEDTDLSWRMRAAGWDIHYVPAAVAHHQHAASSDSQSPLFRFYNTRNSLLVLGRHAPLAVAARSFLRQAAALARYTLSRGEPAPLLRARRRALMDVVKHLPRTARLRRRIWAGRAAQRRAIYAAGVDA